VRGNWRTFFLSGSDMKTVHTGLNITESDWQVGVKLLTTTLEKFKVPQKEKEDVYAALSSLKPDIVGR
jgi:hemoglobin